MPLQIFMSQNFGCLVIDPDIKVGLFVESQAHVEITLNAKGLKYLFCQHFHLQKFSPP